MMDLQKQVIYYGDMKYKATLQQFQNALFQWLKPEKSSHYYAALIGLSLALEYVIEIDYYYEYDFHIAYPIAIGLSTLLAMRAFIVGVDRFFPLIVIMMGSFMFSEFRATANHAFLCLWMLAPLMLFPNQVSTPKYSQYIRLTLGIVMVTAAIQKLISGNFLNGVYFKHLATVNKPGTPILDFLCFNQDISNCDALTYLSIFTVFWQFFIGVFLILNLKQKAIILMELFFVIVVGALTDEMNFQAINVAALMLAFQIRVRPVIVVGIIGLLFIDIVQIENILEMFL